MRNLLENPVWRAEDLGQPIPDSPHACSVALPLWEHVIAYEECRPEILERLQCGYPRFVQHPLVQRVVAHCRDRYAGAGEACLVLPSPAVADACAAYLRRQTGVTVTWTETGCCGIVALVFPESAAEQAELFWRYSGQIVSSRRAEAFLDAVAGGKATNDPGEAAKLEIVERISTITGQSSEDIFLFPSGMAAVFAVHQMLSSVFPGRPCVQFDFPYVDVLRVQKEWGDGVHFFHQAGAEDLSRLAALLSRSPVSAVFCELASNPLLRCPDMNRIRSVTEAHQVPVIADDTIAANVNIDAFQVADVVTTSLTKYFSGASDVMGGSVVLNGRSAWHEAFSTALRDQAFDTLWSADAGVLASNSRDYPERMRRLNLHGEALFDILRDRKEVDTLFYPAVCTRDAYTELCRPGAGYGALLSMVLNDSERTAPLFYDALRVSKGPSLGTNFTLACPYTQLAHHEELAWAASCGISANLLRIAVGLEDPEDLSARFDQAFAAIH